MQERDLIEKFKKKGLEGLSTEDLGYIRSSAVWPGAFKSSTGQDWLSVSAKLSDKLFPRPLTQSKSSSILFNLVSRGDSAKLLQFLKSSDYQSSIKSVDINSKSAMHIAAKENHLEIVKILADKGWDVNSQDKHQTTPLHQACNLGHVDIVKHLLEINADPMIQDSLGRNSLLYAACAPTTEVLDALLEHDQDIITSKDYTGKTALHYAVFNPHSRQSEIIKTLVEAGMDVNVTDDERQTPLHHACEAGKAKAIRCLLKLGSSTTIKDCNSNTPIDLANSNNLKKLISLHTMNEKNTKKLNEQGIKNSYELPSVKLSDRKSGYKDKLFSLLSSVQEAGIINKQHIKKPQIYTGNWMEGIISPIALFNELSYCTPSEAVLKVFNVLFPYTKPIPPYKPTDVIMDEYYTNTYSKTRHEVPIYIVDQSQVSNSTKEIDQLKKTYSELKEILDMKDKVIHKLEQDILEKNLDIHRHIDMLKDSQAKLEEILQESYRTKAKVGLEQDLKNKLQKAENRIKELVELNNKKENRSEPASVAGDNDLLEKMNRLDTDNKNLRFKAGQMFLKSLENYSKTTPQKPQLYIQDIEVLRRLEKSIQLNPPDMKKRLEKIDVLNTGQITLSEATGLFNDIKMVPQDIIVLLRLLGYRQGQAAVPTDDFLNFLVDIDSKEEELNDALFTKLLEKFQENSLGVERAFDYLDINHDGSITFPEFSEAADSLKINLNREDKHALFAALDSDHNGFINLLELKEKLDYIKNKPKSKKFIQNPEKNQTDSIEKRELSLTGKKKRIGRKVVRNNKDLFILNFLENSNLIIIELHLVSETIPLFEVIDQKTIEKGLVKDPNDLKELISKTGVENKKIIVKDIRNIPDTIVKDAEKDDSQSMNNKDIKPKTLISRKAIKFNGRYYLISLYSQPPNIKISVSLADDYTSPMYSQISHKIVPEMPIEKLYSLLTITPSHEIELKSSDPISSNSWNQPEKIHSNTLVLRKALKKNGRYYMVSVYDLNETFKIQINLADDPNIPMYIPQSQVTIEKIPLNRVLSIIEITPTHQLIIKDHNTDIKKTNKKLIHRRGCKINNKYYIISVYSEDNQLVIMNNLVGDTKIPMLETLSRLYVPPMPVSEIFEKLKVSGDHKITLSS
jgi:ankyrin repeat protein